MQVYSPVMDVTEALLESWDRECKIVEAAGTLVTEAW